MGRRSVLMGQMQMTNPNQPYNHAELGEQSKLKFCILSYWQCKIWVPKQKTLIKIALSSVKCSLKMHGHVAFTGAGDLMHDSVKQRPSFRQDQGLLALNDHGFEKTDIETALDTICSSQMTFF